MFDKPQNRLITRSCVLILILTVVLLNNPALAEENQTSTEYGLDTNEIELEHVREIDDTDSSSININEPIDHHVVITSLRQACRDLMTDESSWDKEQLVGKERLWPNPNLSTDECRELLVSYFSKQQIMKYIMPMPILTWFDIFDSIEMKIEAVLSTLRNQNCSIPVGTSSKDLGEQCDTSALVEIAILMESCASVYDIRELRVTVGRDINAPPEYNPHSHYRSSYDVSKRRSDLSELNAMNASASEYWRSLDQIDNSFFRAAYLRLVCIDNENHLFNLFNVYEETKTSGHPYKLWEIASRLRHPIAWVSYVARGSDVMVFMLINPIQTALQHARDSELIHENAWIHQSRWKSELVNKESSVLSGVADLQTFRSFLKQENIHCPNECVYEDMDGIYESLSVGSRKKWRRFFTSAQFDKLVNDRVYWGLVADSLANELQININRDLLYERFINDGLKLLNSDDQNEIQSLAKEKSDEIMRLRTRVFGE